MMKASINILQHMKNSLEGNCTQLSFWPEGKTFDEALKELSVDDSVKGMFKIKSHVHPRNVYISTTGYDEVTGNTSERKSCFIHFRGNAFFTTLHFTSGAS
jgi:hypothetical protein